MPRRPARRDADKAGEGGNVDEGFDPLHAGQSASRRFVPKWLVCGERSCRNQSLFGSDRIRTEGLDSCFDAFSSREPESTSLENALLGGFFFALQQPDQIRHAGGVLAFALWRRGRVVLPAPAPDQSRNHPCLRMSWRRQLLNSEKSQPFPEEGAAEIDFESMRHDSNRRPGQAPLPWPSREPLPRLTTP